MKSAYTLAHELYSLFAFAPKLPRDILYLVVQFSSFEARASLVRCDKWLHAICTPFLFQEIRLYKPIQLIKLYNNKKALDMLSETRAIFLEEGLFCPRACVTDHIAAILIKSTSLLRLQILEIDPITRFWKCLLTPELGNLLRLASSSRFLPKLEIIIGTQYLSLDFLCLDIRPIKFICQHSTQGQMQVELYPGLNNLLAGSQPMYPTYSGPVHNFSPSDIGELIREGKGSSLRRFPLITMAIRFPEDIGSERRAPIQNLLSWLTKLILAAGFSSDGLQGIFIIFNPLPPYLSASAQLTVVTKLHKLLPRLVLARMAKPGLIWIKSQPKQRQRHDTFPIWTPLPSQRTPESIDWWLDQVYLIRFKGTRSHREAGWIAERLREVMVLRHPLPSIPSKRSLVDYLMGVEIS